MGHISIASEQNNTQAVKVDTMALVVACAELLAGTETLPDRLEQIARLLEQASDADVVRFYIKSDSGHWFAGKGGLAAKPGSLDESVLALSIRNGAENNESLAPFARRKHYKQVAAALSSAAYWPLKLSGKNLGVLWLGYEDSRALSNSLFTSITAIAAQATLAVAADDVRKRSCNTLPLPDLLNNLPEPVLVANHEGAVTFINSGTEKLLSLNAASVLGKPADQVLAAFPAIGEALSGRHDTESESEWVGPDGAAYALGITRLEATKHTAGATMVTLRDVSYFRMLIKNQAEFVRLISHDLRTPLTYMKGFANLITTVGTLSDLQNQYLAKVLGGITQMTGLIENIQAAGHWDPETGFYEMHREPTDPAALVANVVSNHQGLAQKQQVDLQTDIATSIPILSIDSLMVERALINLIGNALKYSPNGGKVTVSLRVKDASLQFTVADQGLGIAEEHLPQLFERGQRIITPEIKKNKIKGSGLGLFIVRSVARRHGGDAWVKSIAGSGSTFYFSIPLSGQNLISGGD